MNDYSSLSIGFNQRKLSAWSGLNTTNYGLKGAYKGAEIIKVILSDKYTSD